MSRSAWTAALTLLVWSAPLRAGDFTLLPEASLHLEAGHYAPADQDFTWSTWLGGGAGLARYRGFTAHLSAEVETIIGSAQRTFDPNQANYHVEIGGRQRLGSVDVDLFFNHVSRHTEDRRKTEAVAWNLLGARAAMALPQALHVPGSVVLGLGHTTERALVHYGFEITGQVNADLVRRPWGDVYLDTSIRGVTDEGPESESRGGFVDLDVEGGLRFRRAAGALETFVAYQHRNDVFVERPGVWDRALFGLRIGLAPIGSPPGS